MIQIDYLKRCRRLLVDMHIPDWNLKLLGLYNLKFAVELRHRAGVNAALLAACCLSILPLCSEAKFIPNPDTNTLWVEDGVEVAVGPGCTDTQWGDGLEIESVPGQGMLFRSPSDKKTATCRQLPLDPAFPYMVWEIADMRYTQGYRAC